eukprot:3293654-Rhodomonas_salina.1
MRVLSARMDLPHASYTRTERTYGATMRVLSARTEQLYAGDTGTERMGATIRVLSARMALPGVEHSQLSRQGVWQSRYSPRRQHHRSSTLDPRPWTLDPRP